MLLRDLEGLDGVCTCLLQFYFDKIPLIKIKFMEVNKVIEKTIIELPHWVFASFKGSSFSTARAAAKHTE